MEKKISSFVSICAKKDIKVWEKATSFILENIPCSSYMVIVPRDDVKKFMNVTPPDILVLPEDEIINAVDMLHIKKKIINKDRFGWYLQQLLKIRAISRGKDEDVNLIWDSDTIPLKKLCFIDEIGRLVYYTGSEHHAPYFCQIKKSLQLDKIVDYSFIAQCFPAKVCWVKSYIAALENISNSHWIDAILNSIDSKEVSGFSEYESMGTYFSHNFQDRMSFSKGKWERSGSRLLGIEKFSGQIADRLSTRYDFVAFESWDTPHQSFYEKMKRLLFIFSLYVKRKK